MIEVKYIIISPVRDEEATIAKTIESVISQTIKPVQWVIVNDGSKDKTAQIVEGYIRDNPWIKMITLPDRGHRLPGKGIIEAFYAGFDSITEKDWDFIVKLDCDLSFDKYYFENIFREFSANKKLGIASGKTYLPVNLDASKLKLEWCPDNCTRGPSKVYKKDCFEKIGGIRRERGWDTLDDIAAMVEEYEVRSFAKYKIIHYRPIGKLTHTHEGIRSRILMGRHFYYLGYHPLYMILKCIKSAMTDRPYIITGMAMFISYLWSMTKRSQQIEDKRIIKKLQKVQLNRMFGRE